MKTRLGFVSNSSSSNFILAFDKKPKSQKELQKLMFGDKETHGTSYDDFSAPTGQIAKAVFVQLGKSLKLDQILQEFRTGWLDGVTEHFNWDDPDVPGISDPGWEEYNEAQEEREIIRSLEYFNKWKCPDDQVFFCVSFGDDDGPFGGLCEQSGIFDNIHHVRISHH